LPREFLEILPPGQGNGRCSVFSVALVFAGFFGSRQPVRDLDRSKLGS
jgi:hypothetical protein